MGGIYDRRREHLGASDKGVIAVRRRLIDAARGLQEGQEPPHVVTDPELNDFRHTDSLLLVGDFQFAVQFGKPTRALRLANASYRQVRVKRALFPRKTGFGAFVFKSVMKCG